MLLLSSSGLQCVLLCHVALLDVLVVAAISTACNAVVSVFNLAYNRPRTTSRVNFVVDLLKSAIGGRKIEIELRRFRLYWGQFVVCFCLLLALYIVIFV